MNDLAGAIYNVEQAVERVEEAVKNKLSFTISFFIGALLLPVVTNIGSDILHSKLRYSLQYNVPIHAVVFEHRPHDCDFLAAPLGNKYCDYDRTLTEDAKAVVIGWTKSPNSNVPAGTPELAALRNGFSIRHEHRLVIGTFTRLFLSTDDYTFTDVPNSEIVRYEKDLTSRAANSNSIPAGFAPMPENRPPLSAFEEKKQ
jgi:hypothetical protein